VPREADRLLGPGNLRGRGVCQLPRRQKSVAVFVVQDEFRAACTGPFVETELAVLVDVELHPRFGESDCDRLAWFAGRTGFFLGGRRSATVGRSGSIGVSRPVGRTESTASKVASVRIAVPSPVTKSAAWTTEAAATVTARRAEPAATLTTWRSEAAGTAETTGRSAPVAEAAWSAFSTVSSKSSTEAIGTAVFAAASESASTSIRASPVGAPVGAPVESTASKPATTAAFVFALVPPPIAKAATATLGPGGVSEQREKERGGEDDTGSHGENSRAVTMRRTV